MIKHYFKLSFRNLTKHLFHSLINIFGLGLGIATCIVIFIYVKNETSFDGFHKDSDQIYRVVSRHVWASGEVGFSPLQPYEIAEGFKDDIPSVEYALGFRKADAWIGFGKKMFRETIGFTDPDFFEIFSYPFIAGDQKTAFENLHSVIITRELADKMFGDSIPEYTDMIGQFIEFPQSPPNLFMVSGIIENIPENTSLKFDALVPFLNCSNYPSSNNDFGANSVYLKLNEKGSLDEIVKTINSLVDKYRGDKLEELVHYGSLMDSENNFEFLLQPLNDVYLHSSHLTFSYELKGNARSTYILSIIALIILAIACINYVMLTIGKSMDRLKEMGIMKIMGAHRRQIVGQYLSESFILVLLAIIIGTALAEQLLPLLNVMTGKSLVFSFYREPGSYFFLLLILVFIVLITSGYISFSLFRHSNPLSILRNKISFGKRSRFVRTFVILQYFISIALMITTGIITRQLDYMIKKPVGYDQENVVVLSVDFPISKTLLFKEKLDSYPAIQSVSMSDRNFVRGASSLSIRTKNGELIETRILRIDTDYLETLRLELIRGRDFSPEHRDDSTIAVIVNETFVKDFELDDPVGEMIYIDAFEASISILGVVKDFHYDSMKESIMPLMMSVANLNSIWFVFARIDSRNISGAMEQIHEAWNEIVPEYQIEYTFLGTSLEEQYSDEKRWSKITAYSAFIAIFLSCLGLLGLTGLLVSKRTKEISIRKVNGARILDIILLINREFQVWVFAAFILACPIAFYIMHKWLQNFTYKLPIAWWIFALAGLIAISIALMTVTWGSWRYARKNPSDTLHYE